MRFFKTYRPSLDYRLLALLAALCFWAFSNATFWEKAGRYLADEMGAFLALNLVIVALFFVLTILSAVKYLFKPVLVLLVLLAGGASWFIDNLGVLIDTDMVRNVFETTSAEAGDLLTAGYFRHMLLVAVIPSLLILWVRVRFPSAERVVLWNVGITASCIAIIAGSGALYYKPYSAVIRTKRELAKTLNPVTPLVSIAKVALATGNERNVVVKPLGEDATVTTPVDGLSKLRVAVIVVGETARGANFSLGFYERETNPLLKKQDVTYYSNFASCGTATDVSLPCMFSNLKRSGYTHAGGLENETAVDVLRRAGIDMTWIENNTGSKGVADRVRVVNIYNSNDPRFCADGTCDDEIVLEKIDEWLSNVKQDSVLVFHQMGNHGPAYYKRYPEAFRKFVPECTTTELAKCKDQEIVNAYDNAILYTDFVLSGIIDRLKARTDTLATGMLYVSDHGESLGENGLYLHGTPYYIAPDEQTLIPLLAWFSPEFAASMGLDIRCQQQRRENTFSHDNLFSSLLGMMNVSTSVYERDLDMFAACRGGQHQPSLNN
ncbi:phosphoethanolamine--lipid A transferase [Agrobacterium sp.]|uniref:phosphoethanolamine transferase n=1 Tax=Agrobacterium sp. TaxID=361 RepID=UPI0025B8653D|nr:phosphoethanolamine--lipid A transferase [Agrobacterium sp.]MCD4659419.1 phosphoethanolamine--lipid A transferase [Agrobacterium sp.]